MVRAVLIFWLVSGTAGLASAADDGPDAYEFHARAMEAELDGERTVAIDLLMAAFEAAPGDELIAFDLVRLLSEDASAEGRAQLNALLSRTPQNLDQRLLQIYLTLDRGAAERARALAREAARDFPESKEAARLDQRLNPSVSREVSARSTAQEAALFSARALGGVQYDSNVLVVPEQQNPGAAAPEAAARALIDAQLTVRPAESFELTAGFNAGPHLTDAAQITAFDAFAARARARYHDSAGAIEWWVGAHQDTLFVDREAFERFLLTGGLEGGLRYVLGSTRIGMRARGALRDFGAGVNPEDSAGDRDGSRIEALATVVHGSSRWAVFGNVGYQGEHTAGVQQTENGAMATVGGRYVISPLTLGVSGAYELRDYVARALNRLDQRLTGAVSMRLSLGDTWSIVGSASWTENLSSVSPTDGFVARENASSLGGLDAEDIAQSLELSYSRQLFTLGVEAAW